MLLEKIVKSVKQDLAKRKEQVSLNKLKQQLRTRNEIQDFKKALTGRGVSLIAEIKRASPSRGLIRKDFNPVDIARIYTKSGVTAISVLTEESHFEGNLEYLRQVREVTDLPLLRKDFIVDPYQVYEAQAAGADAVLLIVNILNKDKLLKLMNLVKELGMSALVEVHNIQELKVARTVGAEIIGINNRNLETFETDLEHTLQLEEKLPQDRILVSESGISTREDIEFLQRAKVNAVLVGEALMRSNNLKQKVKELLGESSETYD